MKKIKYLISIITLLCLTGCFKDSVMNDITISTSVYPIQYIVDTLYGEHSTISSIYPNDSEIKDFEVTNILLDNYINNDLFIFNGLSKEKEYVRYMLKNNKELKIIDVTSNMDYNYSIEELWLDPNNLLTIANNIKKGFAEYIDSTYLLNEINENYEKLKIDLTNIDGKYYSTVKNSSNNTIIVSNDSFAYLEKYGIEVISLDQETVTTKNIEKAKELLKDGTCSNIYIEYGEKISKDLKEIIEDNKKIKTIELYTMTNLYNLNADYITLMNQNLENLKLELYK